MFECVSRMDSPRQNDNPEGKEMNGPNGRQSQGHWALIHYLAQILPKT